METFKIFSEMSGQEISEDKMCMRFSKKYRKECQVENHADDKVSRIPGLGKYLGVLLWGKTLIRSDYQ